MAEGQLKSKDIEYISDMLRAVLWVRGELGVSTEELQVELKRVLEPAIGVLKLVAKDLEDAEQPRNPA